MRWEYTVTPSHPVRRFACTSDRDEFRDLVTDAPSTNVWYVKPRTGLKVNDQSAFELLQFTVDGQEQRIKRSEKKTGQAYTVNLGEYVVRESKPVRISHTYRTVMPKSGHRLRITVAQPTRDLSVRLDYTDTDIATLVTSDLISSAKRARVTATPGGVASREVSVDAPGWLLPPAEITYVWTLTGEEAEPDDAEDLALAA